MTKHPKSDDAQTITQSERFIESARALGCDEDPAHFDEALKKVARHKPTKQRDARTDPAKKKDEKRGG